MFGVSINLYPISNFKDTYTNLRYLSQLAIATGGQVFRIYIYMYIMYNFLKCTSTCI
jgi:hypothetical protein